jgi:hypothetical protein
MISQGLFAFCVAVLGMENVWNNANRHNETDKKLKILILLDIITY